MEPLTSAKLGQRQVDCHNCHVDLVAERAGVMAEQLSDWYRLRPHLPHKKGGAS